MPYVQVPKDLTVVKTKVIGPFTKRQAICFSIGGAIGVPIFFMTRGTIGDSTAVLIMLAVMLPAFFLAIYEKDGQPAERVLRNVLRSKFFFPQTRPYKTRNFYEIIQLKEESSVATKTTKTKTNTNTSKAKKQTKPKTKKAA